jgi:hypothetical protein
VVTGAIIYVIKIAEKLDFAIAKELSTWSMGIGVYGSV